MHTFVPEKCMCAGLRILSTFFEAVYPYSETRSSGRNSATCEAIELVPQYAEILLQVICGLQTLILWTDSVTAFFHNFMRRSQKNSVPDASCTTRRNKGNPMKLSIVAFGVVLKTPVIIKKDF